MSSPRDRGCALLADLVLGAAIVVIVAAAALAAASVIEARQSAREAARTAAVVAARTGNVPVAVERGSRLAPAGAAITVSIDRGAARARVQAVLSLPHPVTRTVRLRLSEQAEVPVAPYRSNRG